MKILLIICLSVAIVVILSIFVWSFSSTRTVSKLESIICKVGSSYEETNTNKDKRIAELEDLLADGIRVRAELVEKHTIIITHLENRNMAHTETHNKNVIDTVHLTECVDIRDKELTQSRLEITRLDSLLQHVTTENVAMNHKLALMRQNLV
jgi:hypothetical protein